MSILLEGLTKAYGNQRVVDQVSLEVADGEFFVLLGSSGSGKSTILRLIAGLIQPDGGRIVLNGRDVTHLAPQPRGTGFVFQNYSIFRHMTVSENIEFGLKIRKVAKTERARRSEELLELVDLAGLGGRYPNQLSGGQQQRVALARALAYEPSVLLLDEPLGALDVKIRAQLRRSLKDVQRRLRVTTVLVTHDQEEAFELADRIAVVDRGVLLEVGKPEQLYAKPKSLFVAGFLGAGTVLVGQTAEGKARFGPLVLPIPKEVPHEEGASVELLFRPEHVALSAKEPWRSELVLGKGTIVEQTFSGSLRRVRLRLPRLPGTRQVSPIVPFGEEGLLVDATVAAAEPLSDNEQYVSLLGWTILQQAPPRLLVLDSGQGPSAALKLAQMLSARSQMEVTLMGFASKEEAREELRAALKARIDAAGLSEPELHIRHGNFAEQFAAESAGRLLDIVIVPARFENERGPTLNVPAAIRRHEIPLLVTIADVGDVRRVLICTRGGEPGKTDIRIGGRLARQLGASVTLLYVSAGSAAPSRAIRAHLDKGAATLKALEVQHEVCIEPATTPAAGILRKAEEHDIVVLGGHGPISHSVFGTDDVTMQVLTRARRPVLIVPAQEF
jgi:ABC-type Fe3+/spermidine/putrescine transport system ATPase subunit/nucleotide-binding universal stress UspA family protein